MNHEPTLSLEPWSRELVLPGCFNVRDLGDLPTTSGHRTHRNALVRADALDGLDAPGWQLLVAHGVRTVIDLRHHWEKAKASAAPPPSIDRVDISLDGGEDPEFWAFWGGNPRFCTPLYFRPHLQRFPEISGAVIRTIAQAREGAVLFHCGAGRDRTGLVSMLLLSLAEVTVEAIVEDYLLSFERLARSPARLEERLQIDRFLEAECASLEGLMRGALSGLDPRETLARGGLSPEEIERARSRLVVEAP